MTQLSHFSFAVERYAAQGVDVQRALDTLKQISISLHCWQGDDVGGFERQGQELGGGLAVTVTIRAALAILLSCAAI